MSDDFYLPRHEQTTLTELLAQIPALVEDLAVTITRQDRPAPLGPRCTRGDDTQPLPFNETGSEAAEYLHFTVASWARFTVENRGIDYTGTNDTISIARWLRKHIVDLALCPGADEALSSIREAIRNANRACGNSADRNVIPHSPHDVARARYSTLHARGVAAAARELGPEYQRLTERRVRNLATAGVITPTTLITLDGQPTALYLLGDVLDAHLTHPTRQRKATA